MGLKAIHSATANWSDPTRIGSDTTSSGPRCTRLNGVDWVFWRTETGNRVWYSTLTETGWSSPQQHPAAATTSAPAVAAFKNGIFLAWLGGGNSIWTSWFTGTEWTDQFPTGGVTSNLGPALAVYDDLLYMAWAGRDNSVYYKTYDLQYWGGQQELSDTYNISDTPALAVSGNALHLAWYDGKQKNILHCSYDGSNWSTANAVTGPNTQNGPALANSDDGLAMTWRNRADNSVYWSTCSSDTQDWSEPVAIAGAATNDSPGMYGDDKDVRLVWRGAAEDGVWTSDLPAGGAPNPPPTEPRPIPPEIEGILADQAWGDAQTNTYVTVTVTQPDGSVKYYDPVPTDGTGDWELSFDPVLQPLATVSLTASFGLGGKPSDPYVRVFEQSYVASVDIDSVGETSFAGSAKAGQKVIGWRKSDGTKMVDFTTSATSPPFNQPYVDNLKLPDDDLLCVVAADPKTGSMSLFNRKPEGYVAP
ncbi:hypothetical protein [Martelella endophytica]|nr:hypothetical protein [Martelella endophytica]